LIGKVVEGYSTSSLAAGVNYSIFKRIRPMLAKLAKLSNGNVIFTGGVAYNEALRKIIGDEMGVKIVVPENPEYAGAVGCCIDASGN